MQADLTIDNSGDLQIVDLYVLLEVFGSYWSYPSWLPVAEGLDHEDMTIPANYQGVHNLIPGFNMPPVSPAGPLYFYAAMFDDGELSLDHLASNGAVFEFSLE